MVFLDSKKGLKPSQKDLMDAFKTEDFNEIAERIIKHGEIQIPTEYKEKQREMFSWYLSMFTGHPFYIGESIFINSSVLGENPGYHHRIYFLGPDDSDLTKIKGYYGNVYLWGK